MTEGTPLKDVGYFAIADVSTVREVCTCNDADVAAVYLCLVLGTDGTGLRSSWGREAIRKRLSMSWRKVDRCISRLEQQGFISWPDKGSRKVNVNLALKETRPMREGYQAGLERARNGIAPTTEREKKVHAGLQRDGWLDHDGALIAQLIKRKAYLPMSLVGNVKGLPVAGVTCILERIRKSRDPLAFLLLVQMYEQHDLPELGGTDRRFGWVGMDDQSRVTQTAQVRVLLAKDRREFMNRNAVTKDQCRTGDQSDINAYFERLQVLRDAGALEWLFGVFEDDQHDAQMIYPLAIERHGKLLEGEPEHAVGLLATGAAVAIRGHSNLDEWLDWVGPGWLAPVDRMYRKATVKGIPRLVARPRTSATKIWQAERVERCQRWAEYFVGLIAEYDPELIKENKRLREAVDFKESSKGYQGDINDLFRSPKHTAAGAARDDEGLREEWSSWG